MQVRKGLLAVTLVTTLTLTASAVAAEHAQPGTRGDKSRITSIIKRFIVQILDDFSFPPGVH